MSQSSDLELISRFLPLESTRLLELGCGTAFTTRKLVQDFPGVHIYAAEVDQIQHAKNLAEEAPPGVEFMLAGMQELPLPDASVDGAIMLKSLHHVPTALMDAGFAELARVLRPNGRVYISEPVYAGAFNEILRLFNDEKRVREAAFQAIARAVDGGAYALVEEVHFLSVSRFEGFAEFERRILGATHSEFDIDAGKLARIREAFEPHIGGDGVAEFHNPMRVDVLQRL